MVVTVCRGGYVTFVGRTITSAVNKLAVVGSIIEAFVDVFRRVGFAGKCTALEITFCILRTDVIVSHGTVPVTIQEMQFAVAATGHTLLASFVPPAVAICDIVRPV